MSETPRVELGRGLVLEPALLLAPMEGVTDRSFRGLVIEGNAGLGAACTEYLRVTQQPLPVKRIQEELGSPATAVPVGVQLMGNEPEHVAESAVRAAEAGAAFVDLNFGCPAPRVYQHCAGSALLDDLPALETMVRQVAQACPRPVTAKIRAGGAHDRGVEEIARRVEQAGAAALIVHGRLRVEKYTQPTRWERIRRAVEAVSLPVIGNGSAEDPALIDAMLAETGCAGVMVGHGALANPWIFGDWDRRRRGLPPARRDLADYLGWLREYARRMARGGATPLQVVGRLKGMVRSMVRGGTLRCGTGLREVLQEGELEALLARLAAVARVAQAGRAAQDSSSPPVPPTAGSASSPGASAPAVQVGRSGQQPIPQQ